MSTDFRRSMSPCGNTGFVLVSVLWILAILTVIVLGFGRRAILEHRASRYALDQAQALQMARGAVQRGILELKVKAVVDQLNEQVGYTGLDQRWARPVDLMREQNYFRSVSGEDFKGDFARYTIEDCDRRININAVSEDFLREIPGIPQSAVRKIIYRRQQITDVDEEDLEGAQGPQRFFSIDEVRELGKIKHEDWYGTRDEAGLRDLITVWGDAHVNLNTASREVLEAIPGIDDRVVSAIIEYRQGDDGELFTRDDKAIPSLNELAKTLDLSGEVIGGLHGSLKTSSNSFIVTGEATRRNGKIRARVEAVLVFLPRRFRRSPPPPLQQWREYVSGA